jgi:hypothetical protein
LDADQRALSAALRNYAFIEHFPDIARGHCRVRRLERIYGKERFAPNMTLSPDSFERRNRSFNALGAIHTGGSAGTTARPRRLQASACARRLGDRA